MIISVGTWAMCSWFDRNKPLFGHPKYCLVHHAVLQPVLIKLLYTHSLVVILSSGG